MTSSIDARPDAVRLVRATLLAAAVAGVLLVTVILPAEYGLDPTGVGRAVGLYRAPEASAVSEAAGAAPSGGEASASAETATAGTPAAAGAVLTTSPVPFRTDEMSLTLAPGEGAEIKAEMTAGERMVYSWTSSGGGVDVDMHGETGRRGDEARSYEVGELKTSGHGAFTAPMAGNHGWFWQNLNDAPVTITVKTAGFYRRLFQP